MSAQTLRKSRSFHRTEGGIILRALFRAGACMSYGGGSLSNGSNGAGPEGSGWLGRKGNEWLFVNPYLVVGVVGASFCFAWMFSILLRPGYPGIEAFGPHSSQLFRVVFAGVLAVTDLIIALLSNVLQRHRRPLLAVGATGALASELLPLLPAASESSVAFFAAAIAAAVGLGLLGALWMEFLCAHLKQAARKAASTLFLLALVWYLGLLLVDSAFVTGISMLFVLLSTATYAVLSALYAPMDTMPEVDARDSDSRYAITWRPSLLTVMGSLAEGFALYWLLDPSGNEEVNAYLVCLLALVVCAAVLVDSVKRFVLRERVIRRLFLPVLAACFLTVLFLPRQWIFVPCLLAYGFSMLPYLSAIFATCEHIVRCRLSPIRAFARARVPAAARAHPGAGHRLARLRVRPVRRGQPPGMGVRGGDVLHPGVRHPAALPELLSWRRDDAARPGAHRSQRRDRDRRRPLLARGRQPLLPGEVRCGLGALRAHVSLDRGALPAGEGAQRLLHPGEAGHIASYGEGPHLHHLQEDRSALPAGSYGSGGGLRPGSA